MLTRGSARSSVRVGGCSSFRELGVSSRRGPAGNRGFPHGSSTCWASGGVGPGQEAFCPSVPRRPFLLLRTRGGFPIRVPPSRWDSFVFPSSFSSPREGPASLRWMGAENSVTGVSWRVFEPRRALGVVLERLSPATRERARFREERWCRTGWMRGPGEGPLPAEGDVHSRAVTGCPRVSSPRGFVSFPCLGVEPPDGWHSPLWVLRNPKLGGALRAAPRVRGQSRATPYPLLSLDSQIPDGGKRRRVSGPSCPGGGLCGPCQSGAG